MQFIKSIIASINIFINTYMDKLSIYNKNNIMHSINIVSIGLYQYYMSVYINMRKFHFKFLGRYYKMLCNCLSCVFSLIKYCIFKYLCVVCT